MQMHLYDQHVMPDMTTIFFLCLLIVFIWFVFIYNKSCNKRLKKNSKVLLCCLNITPKIESTVPSPFLLRLQMVF